MVETVAVVIKEMVETVVVPAAVTFREMQYHVPSQHLENHMYGELLDRMLLTVPDWLVSA